MTIDFSLYLTYLIVVVVSTYLIRSIPFCLVKRKIENQFVSSVLYYIPYAVLTAMTFPEAVFATSSIWSALAGILVAIVMSTKIKSLPLVALGCCVSALLVECILRFV